MKNKMDNTAVWNEAGKGALYLGGLSVLCLSLKEVSALSGSNFLITAASIILWVVEFFGCILLMKRFMLDFRDKYEGVQMADTARLGRRMALLSGLLLASAQALFIMQMPQEEMNALVDQLSSAMSMGASEREAMDGVIPRLPVLTFVFQWLYCYLYGTVLASILSRYIFMQEVLGTRFRPTDENEDKPDEQ
ncbi:MAG: hypothetical protein II454_08990 [Bacteroidales bacterium]|jgi:hypothetical protein|nr:hypothetical protein [Bacteroidales bacterium]